MRKPLKKIAIILLGMISLLRALGEDAPLSSTANTSQEVCPAANTLVQLPDMTWIAPGDWKSSGPSFLKEVDKFVGAQWIGINVGQIICIYIKSGREVFPVHMQREVLVVSPSGGAWTDDKGGYKDCKSIDQSQCSFLVKVTPQPTNIYEDLNFYKGKEGATGNAH